MYQQALKSCEEALRNDDMFTIQRSVDMVAKWLASPQTPPEVRDAFCGILRAKADETANRVIAVYLRTVAHNYMQL